MVEIIPVLEKSDKLEIRWKISILNFTKRWCRSQNVNKAATRPCIVHVPTGISAHVTNERKSKKPISKKHLILFRKNYSAHLKLQRKNEINDCLFQRQPNEWGNQIRSYVLHPVSDDKKIIVQILEVRILTSFENGEIKNFSRAEKRTLIIFQKFWYNIFISF